MSIRPFRKTQYDEAAFAQLYRQHVTMVRNRARSILKNEQEAEDIAHETFLKFIRYQQEGQDARETAAFLYRTATNLSLNKLRNEKRRRQLVRERVMPVTAHQVMPAHQDGFDEVLQQVPEKEALIAVHYYVDGMAQQEIADLTGMQRRTVGRYLERFNAAAKKILQLDEVSP